MADNLTASSASATMHTLFALQCRFDGSLLGRKLSILKTSLLWVALPNKLKRPRFLTKFRLL